MALRQSCKGSERRSTVVVQMVLMVLVLIVELSVPVAVGERHELVRLVQDPHKPNCLAEILVREPWGTVDDPAVVCRIGIGLCTQLEATPVFHTLVKSPR